MNVDDAVARLRIAARETETLLPGHRADHAAKLHRLADEFAAMPAEAKWAAKMAPEAEDWMRRPRRGM